MNGEAEFLLIACIATYLFNDNWRQTEAWIMKKINIVYDPKKRSKIQTGFGGDAQHIVRKKRSMKVYRKTTIYAMSFVDCT